MRRYAFAVLALLTTLPLFASIRIIGPWPGEFADPGAPYTLLVRYYNDSPAAAAGTIQIELPEGTSIASLPEGCTGGGRTATCAVAPLAPQEQRVLRLPILTPADFTGRDIFVRLTASAGEVVQPVRLIRTFVVDNAGDDGPGSLRRAILDANVAGCSATNRCEVSFRFAPPVPASGWYTIQPRSELPVLTANWTGVDGAMQTFLTGDTNPAGPEIEINGALAGGANGLIVENGGDLEIRGLTVNGFFWNGIEFRGKGPEEFTLMTFRVVRDNYIGTDPTGTHAVPNGMRGISVFGWGAKMVNNVISGNGRSGVFWWGRAGAFVNDDDYALFGNRIGVRAASDDPLPNGASGVFLGPEAIGVDLGENVIAYNRHFGVAMAAVTENALARNRIWGNAEQPIDLGLDRRSPVFGPELDRIVTPVLERATFDPVANVTIIDGRVPGSFNGYGYYLEVYRGGEMREFVLRTAHQHLPSFQITVPGDQRGQTFAVTLTRQQYHGWLRGPRTNANWQGFETQTSELSDPIVVE